MIWCAAVVLPTHNFGAFGMSGSLEDVLLKRYAPVCYSYAIDPPKISGWARGFEDNGENAHKRKFPIYYLDNSTEVPQEGPLVLSNPQSYAWAAAKNLELLNFHDTEEYNRTQGCKAAHTFAAKLERIRGSGNGREPESMDGMVPSSEPAA
jgi:hypothetical protein